MPLSCGVIPVKDEGEGWLFLLLRSYRYWDFPKGGQELDESPLETALRELEEETGIQHTSSPWGDEYIETESYGKDKIARYYLRKVGTDARVSLRPNPVTGIFEHHEFRWLDYEAARGLLVPRVQRIIDWAQMQISSQ